MTLSSSDKKTLSSTRMEKAYEFLSDAEANLKESRSKTSVNRSYYSVLHAMRALLILEGVDTETHSGAITTFSLRFIKTGLLDKNIIKEIKTLSNRRIDVDYGDFENVDDDDAFDSLEKAKSIIEAIDTLRKKLITESAD